MMPQATVVRGYYEFKACYYKLLLFIPQVVYQETEATNWRLFSQHTAHIRSGKNIVQSELGYYMLLKRLSYIPTRGTEYGYMR